MVVGLPHEGGSVVFCFWREHKKRCLWGIVRKWETVTFAREQSLVRPCQICLIICFRAETSRLSGAAGAPCPHRRRRDAGMWIIFAVTRYTLRRQEPPASLPAHAGWPPIGRLAWARFDKRMSGAADRDQARSHETMVVRVSPLRTRPDAAQAGFPTAPVHVDAFAVRVTARRTGEAYIRLRMSQDHNVNI